MCVYGEACAIAETDDGTLEPAARTARSQLKSLLDVWSPRPTVCHVHKHNGVLSPRSAHSRTGGEGPAAAQNTTQPPHTLRDRRIPAHSTREGERPSANVSWRGPFMDDAAPPQAARHVRTAIYHAASGRDPGDGIAAHVADTLARGPAERARGTPSRRALLPLSPAPKFDS